MKTGHSSASLDSPTDSNGSDGVLSGKKEEAAERVADLRKFLILRLIEGMKNEKKFEKNERTVLYLH
jgi:hypothetical protein